MKHVVLYVRHMYKPFWTKEIWPGWQGGSGKVKIGQNIAQNRPRFWLWSPLEAPKWVEDPWKGFKSTRGSWGYHLGSVSGVLDPFRGLKRAPKPKSRPILGNTLTYFDPPWPPCPTPRANSLNRYLLCMVFDLLSIQGCIFWLPCTFFGTYYQ